jgi:hypothetical protein
MPTSANDFQRVVEPHTSRRDPDPVSFPTMFSKKERLFLQNVDPNTLLQTVQSTLQQQAIVPTAPTGGGYLGIGPNIGYGIKPKVTVTVIPAQGGHFVDISIGTEFDQSSMVLAIILLVIFWPILALLAFFAYQGFEQRAGYMLATLRSVLAPYAGANPGAPGAYYPPGP